MSDKELLGSEGFGRHLAGVRRSAFRLELQTAYNEPSEHVALGRWLVGDPLDPDEQASSVSWRKQIRAQTAAGVQWCRVRVHEDPPTPYQQWERWSGRRNIQAGEDIRYLTRVEAHDIGLLPAAGDEDWWLIDDEYLIVMGFDELHRRVRNEIVRDPAAVEQAREWWDLAVRHARPETDGPNPR